LKAFAIVSEQLNSTAIVFAHQISQQKPIKNRRSSLQLQKHRHFRLAQKCINHTWRNPTI